MNTNKKLSVSSFLAAAALIATIGSANAGGQIHRLPTDYGTAYPAYEIRIASMPTAGHMLTIQLVDKQTGQLITNADVSMQHLAWRGMKAVPQYAPVLVALDPDGRGNFVCMREHLRSGERIVVRAHVNGEQGGTWSTLALSI